MEKKQFIAAGILILASVGLIGAMESEPKAETENKAEGLAARILELERKIDAQEKLIEQKFENTDQKIEHLDEHQEDIKELLEE